MLWGRKGRGEKWPREGGKGHNHEGRCEPRSVIGGVGDPRGCGDIFNLGLDEGSNLKNICECTLYVMAMHTWDILDIVVNLNVLGIILNYLQYKI